MSNPFASPMQLKPDGTIVDLSAPFDYEYGIDFKVWIPPFTQWPNPVGLNPALIAMGRVRLNDSNRIVDYGPNTGFSLVWLIRYPATRLSTAPTRASLARR